MTDVRYNIHTLFEKAFGIQNAYIPGAVEIKAFNPAHLTNIEKYRHIRRISQMGTPVMFPFTLKGGSYPIYNKDGILEKVNCHDFLMPTATMVDFRRPMIVTDTAVLGGKGTVKEVFGFEDWRIRIRGICFNDSSRLRQPFAYEQQKALIRRAQIAGSIPVVGELFNDKSIYAIVLKDISFRQLQGSVNMLPFEISAVSDNPIELVHLL